MGIAASCVHWYYVCFIGIRQVQHWIGGRLLDNFYELAWTALIAFKYYIVNEGENHIGDEGVRAICKADWPVLQTLNIGS